jgi:Zn-dependent protease
VFSRGPRQAPVYQGYGYPYRPRSPLRMIVRSVNWGIVLGFVVVLAASLYGLIVYPDRFFIPGTVLFVVVGWIFSLCLHEFAHAATAVLGGDFSDSTASYLSFNPFKYLHPVYSLVLPVVFMLLGFVALPGGAVYLRRDLVRSRGWQSAISLAGPAMNLLVLLALSVPFALGVTDRFQTLAPALAALAFFELAAVVLNLLPVPGLDGFGALAPWLPASTLAAVAPLYTYGTLILLIIIWQVPFVNAAYFSFISSTLISLHIDPGIALTGLNMLHPQL